MIRRMGLCAATMVALSMAAVGVASPAHAVVTCNGLEETVAGNTGTDGDDVIDGRGGDDTICARGGTDNVYGGRGEDLIFGGPGADGIWGDSGSSSTTFGDSDTIFGGDGEDYEVVVAVRVALGVAPAAPRGGASPATPASTA